MTGQYDHDATLNWRIFEIRNSIDPHGKFLDDDFMSAMDLLADIAVAMKTPLARVLAEFPNHYQTSLEDKANGDGIWSV